VLDHTIVLALECP